jgi:hypothetical protein
MSARNADSGDMVLLPYTPRADSDSRGYDEWLRTVDNPFFNGVPGIQHYSNWKVAEVLWGDIGFTHFDYMRLEPGRGDEVWANPDVVAFASGWVEKWGVEPQSQVPGINYHSYRLRRIGGEAPRFGSATILGIGASNDGDGEQWEVSQPMMGTPIAQRFATLMGGVSPDRAWAEGAARGTLIAAP